MAGPARRVHVPASLQAVIDSKLSSQPVTSAGGLTLTWGSRGAVAFHAARHAPGRFVLRPESVGRSAYRPFAPGPFVFAQREVTEDLGRGVTAWYKAAGQGFEQGFTLSRRPPGASARFSLVLGYAGDLRARPAGTARIVLSGRSGAVLAYGGLRVTDARGTAVPATLSEGRGEVRIVVTDSRAVYPLTIDPYVVPSGTPAATFTGPPGSFLGSFVALSGNGQTALFGAPTVSGDEGPDDGAAYLYTESNGSWPSAPTASFIAPVGSNEGLGVAVALSDDGQTALIATQDKAVNLYTAASGWSSTPAATFTSTNSDFGAAVALSGDGQTALIGAINSQGGAGAAYLYHESGGSWPSAPTATLTGSDAFGSSVALSGDGQTALVGAAGEDTSDGAAYLYTGSAQVSDVPTAVFTAAPGSQEQLGAAVALSGDGQTALLGAPDANGTEGAAYLYAASSGSWPSAPTATFAGSASSGDNLGSSVALSSDGLVVLAGAPSDSSSLGGAPAAYLYTGYSGWSAAPAATFADAADIASGIGSSVALSDDGETALVGAPFANGGTAAGGAFLYTAPPGATAPSPPSGVSAQDAGPGAAAVSWSPPATDGGSPVISYTVTAADVTTPANGGQTATGAASPLTMTGLTPGDSYSFTVTAANAAGTSAPSEPSNVVTVGQAPAITSAASASTGMRTPFSFTVTTTAVPTAALTESGALPAGITFTDNGDGTATLAGTAAAGTAGSYPLTITGDNGDGSPATQAFTLTVTTATAPPAITSAAAETATFGVPFSYTITTTGYPAPRLTRTGALPSGVTFTDNGNGTATLAGTPGSSAVGSYPLTLTAKSTAGTATQSFTLTVTKAPVIKKIPTTTASTGAALSLTITASGDLTPALTETGTLPSGVTFTDNGNGTATIAGTPAAGTGGSYPVTITAANQLGSSSQTFTLNVDQPPAFTSPAGATATAGSAFSFSVTTTGYPAPRLTRAGTLPAGITFRAATGTFAGTPRAGTEGTYSIAITAANTTSTVTQNFTLTVSGP